MFGNIDHFVGAKYYEQTIDVESMDVSDTYQVNCLLYPNCTERIGNAMKPKGSYLEYISIVQFAKLLSSCAKQTITH
jgi:hypothetical protein